MNLSLAEANQFFKLMWALQFYVNRQLNLLSKVESIEVYAHLKTKDKQKVREALYKHADLIDRFVAENPADLPADEVQIVRGWTRFINDEFYILRHLKRHTIFVSAREPKVYGVLGLQDDLADIVPAEALPILVQTVLLPFKGRIIYDGLFYTYSITFGAGIRGNLNEIYQRAKQRGEIIKSLEPGTPTAVPARKPAPDWRPAVDEIMAATEKLKRTESVVQARAFGVLKASAVLAQAATQTPDDLEQIDELGRRVQKALAQLETALDRAR